VNAYKLTRPIRYYCPRCDLIVAESPCGVCNYEHPIELKPLGESAGPEHDDKANK
jgi:hypothetical protein